MDKKSIKQIIGLFSFLIIMGCLSTIIIKSIIDNKMDALYETATEDDVETTKPSSESREPSTGSVFETTHANGPVNNLISEEKYMNELKTLELQIEDVWANVTESNSALSAAKYEKGVWDEQLNKIYSLYIDEQSSVNAEKVIKEHNAFVTEREKAAISAAKSASEALDGLTYNKEYAKLTKEKTYEYIERYFIED